MHRQLEEQVKLFAALPPQMVQAVMAAREQSDAYARGLAALEAAGVKADAALVNCGRGYVPHGAAALLQKRLGLDRDSLFHRAREVLGRER